ncbi:TonB-dependent receptor [Winogradskyella haliclonae]|uniref:Cell envelope biogenesis protein OmpA n=1 Tax=Winogradskyella haliclonae TaxID=2048558 RepID=A0ABQ2BW83_9FLAO|nr:TonB-dependent receptor [Winogradskyella haliclonae]GGI56670.1 cell envelope biogenesis protein OmpA [Winogradskyella haliclonae]
MLPRNTIFLYILLFISLSIFAQETTGRLDGKISDISNQPLSFANILVTDLDTNFKYGSTSQESGYYLVSNLPPGTNYKVEISLLGFKTEIIQPVVIRLGVTTTKDRTLIEDQQTLDEIVITNSPNGFKKNNDKHISKSIIKQTPTISRSIQDLTRTLPEANLNSFAGASNRFNNLNIDGIANNDVVGFQEPASGASGSSANGTPGSLSRTQPIAFGAIKELSVKTTPFDVSIGNFTGANINVVTKNGGNKTKVEVYGFGNNEFLIGKYANGKRQVTDNFYDIQVGGGIGGAIAKDKLFYYINIEQALSNLPLLNAPGGSGSNISFETVSLISETLKNRYNYDPGTFTSANIETASTKIFARLDYNISKKHKLTLRHNYVKSFSDNLEWNESIFNFGNQGYRHRSTANSLAAELKSSFSESTSNVLNIGYNSVKDDRDFDGRVFPHLLIQDESNRIFAGTYREASVYKTDLNTFQITNTLTYIKDKHTFKVGGLAQYNDIDYGFLSAWNGRWQYRSVDDFVNDRPSRIRGVYRTSNNNFDFVSNTPSATLDILTLGLYAQDRIRFSDRFSLLAGVRLDSQALLDDLPLSDEVRNTPEFSRFENKINSAPQINPRVGFNYFFNEDKNIQLRGGSGLFTGRIPYLWFAYAEYISGTDYFNVDIRPTEATPIIENLEDLATQQPGLTEINLIDNDFDLPREWKTNIALDIKLPKSFNLSLEGTYSKVVKGIFFQSINRRNNKGNFTGADNREYFLETGTDIKINPNFTNVFLLTNTNKGYRYNLTLGLSKSTKNYNAYLGYTYGKSKDISSTVRNSQAANFEWNQAINSNNPDLSFSNFDLRHKIVSSQSYNFNLNTKSNLSVSFLYNGTAGSPFSFVVQGDVNRDGSSRNDLVFVPRNENDIELVDFTDSNGNVVTAETQWINLNNYINNNDYLNSRRGNYTERNGARTPWNHRLDAKLEYSFNIGKQQKLRLSMDVFNVLNLVNRNWGQLYFVPNVVNSSFSLLNFRGIENEQPTYTFNINDTTPWVIDTENSRWRAQFGLAYQF